ncbi:MAG: phasin family protein [Blastocatellia bacterium]|nr:phasin family protein [Blastocatellia bacterium]
MARIIKRYANRKLYDSTSKKYMTLEAVASLVEAGEDVHIIDKETGSDITEVILSKVISEMVTESAKKKKSWVPASMLSDMIQKRSDAVVDYVKQGFAAGIKTVKDVEEQIQHQLQQQWKRVTGSEEKDGDEKSNTPESTEEAKTIIQRMVEESVQFLISKMNLPTRAEIVALNHRLDEIEKQLKMARKRNKASETFHKVEKISTSQLKSTKTLEENKEI